MSLRSRILEAAERIISEQGHQAFSMRKCGESVGTSAMAIYRHYRDREDLLDAVAESGFDKLERSFSDVDSDQPRPRVELMLLRYMEFSLEWPNLFELMFLVPRRGVRRFPDDFSANRSRAYRVLQDAVDLLLESMSVEDDPLEATLDLWAHAHGLVALYRVGRFGNDLELFRAVFDRSIRRLLDAYRPPS